MAQPAQGCDFEHALIRERQCDGIALAKQHGAYYGRKKAIGDARVAELRRRAEARLPWLASSASAVPPPL